MSKRLWEVDHPYYCNNGNYYSSDCGEQYESWAEFFGANGDSDFDMNLVFRFDWMEGLDDDEKPLPFNGDVNYRNGKLYVYWMGQRKGLYRYSMVDVCRADEPAVIEFLKPRLAHLLKLWEPLS
jgi:hypothetical protein